MSGHSNSCLVVILLPSRTFQKVSSTKMDIWRVLRLRQIPIGLYIRPWVLMVIKSVEVIKLEGNKYIWIAPLHDKMDVI